MSVWGFFELQCARQRLRARFPYHWRGVLSMANTSAFEVTVLIAIIAEKCRKYLFSDQLDPPERKMTLKYHHPRLRMG
jgi:hypothetical protein